MDADEPETSKTAEATAWKDLQTGQLDRAEAWARTISLTSNNVDSQWIAAKIFLHVGKTQLAQPLCESIIAHTPGKPEVRFALACGCAQLGQSEKAREQFQLSDQTDNPQSCAAFASALADGGNAKAAIHFISGLADELRTSPPVAIRYAGLVSAAGDNAAASTILRNALDTGIDDPALRAQAWFNLGVLLETSETERAEDAYRNAVESNPDYLKANHNLAVCLVNNDGPADQARHFLDEARARFPESIELLYLSAYQHRLAGGIKDAIVELRQLIKLTNDHAQGWELLGRCLSDLGRFDEAKEHYHLWLHNQPEHPIASHMMSALSGEESPDRASAAYVADTFDAFADTFNTLLKKLEYQGPQLFSDLLAKHYQGETGQRFNVLDAGCGTGLLANVLRPYAQTLIGVDLSPVMLRHAKATGAYDELMCRDLVDFLEHAAQPFDLIVASDTFNYFGDLGKLLRVSIEALKPGGILAFSVEQGPLSDDCYTLMPHGRYIHSPHYLVWLMGEQGVTGGTMCKVVLRKEDDAEVNALLIIAQRPNLAAS